MGSVVARIVVVTVDRPSAIRALSWPAQLIEKASNHGGGKITGFRLIMTGCFHHRCFYFQFKSVNISTILTSKLKICVYVWRLDSWLLLGIYIYLTWNLV